MSDGDTSMPDENKDARSPRHPYVERAAVLARRGSAEDIIELVGLTDNAASEGVRDEVVQEIEKTLSTEGRAVLRDLVHVGDQTLIDASLVALANGCDDCGVGEIAAAYDAECDPEAQERLADVLRYVRSPASGTNLLALSSDLAKRDAGDNALSCAAMEAMGNVGTTQVVASLLERLEQASTASVPAYDAMLGALSRVDNPESRLMLVDMVKAGLAGELRSDLYWAAVRALRFHHESSTRELLERVARSGDDVLASAASNSLRVMSRMARQ
jgi:hypothetical protein